MRPPLRRCARRSETRALCRRPLSGRRCTHRRSSRSRAGVDRVQVFMGLRRPGPSVRLCLCGWAGRMGRVSLLGRIFRSSSTCAAAARRWMKASRSKPARSERLPKMQSAVVSRNCLCTAPRRRLRHAVSHGQPGVPKAAAHQGFSKPQACCLALSVLCTLTRKSRSFGFTLCALRVAL